LRASNNFVESIIIFSHVDMFLWLSMKPKPAVAVGGKIQFSFDAASSTLSHSSLAPKHCWLRLNGSSSKKYHSKARSLALTNTHTHTAILIILASLCARRVIGQARNICCGQFGFLKTQPAERRREREHCDTR
jgi:hypothetical protein